MNNAFFRFDDFESSPISLQWIVQDDQPIHSRNISSRARGTRSTLAKEREKKKKSHREMSFPRVNFWNSLTHRPIQNLLQDSPRQGSIEWILRLRNFLDKLFRSISPSRSLHNLLFFPRKQPILTDPRFHHYFPSRFLIIVLFLREIESSPISSQLRQLLIYPTATGNRSFCRNGFHPPSIFVSFRLIDLSLRIFVSPWGVVPQGGKQEGEGEGFGHASTNDRPFFASCRVSPGSYTLPNRERDIIRRDPRPLEF